MNAERLRAAIDMLLDIEKRNNIQSALEGFVGSLKALVENNTAENQIRLALFLDDIKGVEGALRALTPTQRTLLADVDTDQYFRPAFFDDIRARASANALSPAVLLDEISKSLDERKAFLNVLRSTRSGLRNLGVKPVSIEPGEADISILIPRNLFHDDLDGLQRELKTINSILRTFYELANVTPGPIVVKEISTSDPTFFLGIDIAPVIALGLAIKWAIDVIKGSHEIKKIAENARKATVPEEIVKQLEKSIQDKVEERLTERVTEMLAKFGGDTARRNELETPTRFALEQLMQRIERGLIIEIHAAPPVLDVTQAENQDFSKVQRDFAELSEIAGSIEYPQIEGEPVLQLTTGDETKAK